MRIFVTGGTGILGRSVVPLLRARGHEVAVLTRSASAADDAGSVRGDLADADTVAGALRDFGPEVALHLAWQGLPDYALPQTLQNLDLSLRFFSLAAQAGCRAIVSTGSCWEYVARTGQLAEDAPTGGVEPFVAAKNSLRALGESIANAHGARFAWLRLFFVYGPGQRPNSLVPSVIEAVRRGERPALKAPYNRHDFVFVDDVASAMAAVIERRPPGSVYNVGSGYPTAVADVTAAAERLLGRSQPTAIPDGTPQQNFWADISRLHRDTGWQPAYDLESGLRATLGVAGSVAVSAAGSPA